MIEYLNAVPLPARYASLRNEVREFIARECADIPMVHRAHTWQGRDGAFSKKLAERGWVGLTIPKRYGGAELDPLARFVVVEELLCAGAPVAAHWVADRQSGPLLLKFGSEEQKQFYLPRICRGEAFFSIGMSEPGSGSDLASVSSTARKTDSGWILRGQKIWTSGANRCDYMIALVRTSGTVQDKQDRHAGLSQFIVDPKLPGVTIRPIRDLTGSEHFCEVFFDDVALPNEALVGNEGDGWKQVTAELAFERSGPERIYSSHILLEAWLNWVSRSGRLKENARLAGRLMSHLYVLRGLSVAITAQLAEGKSPVVGAALVKDLGTTFEQSIPALLSDALSTVEPSDVPPPLAATLNYLTCVAPSFSLRGGTREVLRGMIARGLGVR